MDEMNQKPKKVLLVEDDDSLASVYLTRFEAEGFVVKEFLTAKKHLLLR